MRGKTEPGRKSCAQGREARGLRSPESQVERVYHDCRRLRGSESSLRFMVGRSLASSMKFQWKTGDEGLTVSLNRKSELKRSAGFLATEGERARRRTSAPRKATVPGARVSRSSVAESSRVLWSPGHSPASLDRNAHFSSNFAAICLGCVIVGQHNHRPPPFSN